MVMEGLAFGGRDTVDVETRKGSLEPRNECSSCFFQDLTAGGIEDGLVFGFDVAAGQEPAVEAAVMDQQNGVRFRIQHQPCSGDMAGGKLSA